MNESKRNGNGLGEQWASSQASEHVIIISYTHVITVLYFQYSLLMILLKLTLLSPFKMNYFLDTFLVIIVQFVNPNDFDGCIYDCVFLHCLYCDYGVQYCINC